MTLLFRPLRFSITAVSALAVLFLLSGNRPSSGQGLSGPPQRLEETLGQRDAQNQAGNQGPSNQGPSNQGSSNQGSSNQGSSNQGNRGPSAQGGGGNRGPSSQGSQGPPPGYGSGGPGGPGGQGPGGGSQGFGQDEMDMEMDMDAGMEMGGYGGSYGPPSSGRARATGTPAADAMQIYGSSLITARDSLDFSALFAPAPDVTVESGPVLGREAELAFQSGYHGLALELMFGHMTTEFKDALVAVKTVKYNRALSRPVWAMRWGVSIAVRGDAIDPQPIREGATPRAALAGGGRGGRGPGGRGPGQFGSDMEMEMDMEMDMSEQGMEEEMGMEMEMDMEMEMGMAGGSRRGGPAGRSPAALRPSIPVRKMLSDDANETLEKPLGLVAKVVAEQFSKRFQQGDFGPVFANVSAPAAVEPVRGFGQQQAAAPMQTSMSEELNDALSSAPEPLPMWQPGIVFLGSYNNFTEVIPVAKAAGIDVILHFDVGLKQGRGNTQNSSRCRVINVATQKSVGLSKQMSNWEAAQFAAAGRMSERAYVEEQLSNLFEIVDRDFKVEDLPAFTPAIARRRIAQLISGPSSHTLRTLAEIRLFQARELIDESEVEAAFDIVGGVEALTLLHGARDERIKLARKWAIESQSVAK